MELCVCGQTFTLWFPVMERLSKALDRHLLLCLKSWRSLDSLGTGCIWICLMNENWALAGVTDRDKKFNARGTMWWADPKACKLNWFDLALWEKQQTQNTSMLFESIIATFENNYCSFYYSGTKLLASWMGKRLQNCPQPRQITADAGERKDYGFAQRHKSN